MSWYDEYIQQITDPLGRFQPAAQQQPQAPVKLPPLSPEEQDSLLTSVTGKALGGLGYAGSVLEKTLGGRAVRGLLGGHPRELLSPLPFSDTLGITNEEDRVSGRDLLRKAGVVSGPDNWGNFAAGLGLELATDPAMYLSFGGGALTEAGNVASKVGLLPETLAGRTSTTLGQALSTATPEIQQAAAEAARVGGQNLGQLAGQRLGGVVGIGLPFQRPSAVLGASDAGTNFIQGASNLASQVGQLPGVSHAGKAIGYVGRLARANFDPAVQGAVSAEGQATAKEATTLARQLGEKGRSQVADLATQLQDAGLGQSSGAELRQGLEGVLQGPAHPAEAAVAGTMRGTLDQQLQTLQDLGVDIKELQDPAGIKYAPRQQIVLQQDTPGFGSGRPRQALPTRDIRIEGREDILKGLPGGTEDINQLGLDPRLSGPNRIDPATGTRTTDLTAAAMLRQQFPGMGQEQAMGLGRFVGDLDPQILEKQLRVFGNHPLADYETYLGRTARLQGAAEATHNLLARNAINTATAPAPAGSVPVAKVLEDAGLRMNVGGQAGAAPTGAQATLAARLGVTPQHLGQFVVPPEIAGDATRFLRGFTTPDSVTPVIQAWDYLTNLTKGYQTATWPGFHVRNFVTGLWQNWVAGGLDPRFADPISGFLQPLKDMKAITEGAAAIPGASTIPGLAGLSDTEATAKLAQEMYAMRAAGHGLANIGRDIVGTGATAGGDLPNLLAKIPGNEPETLIGAVRKAIPQNLAEANPLNIHGAGANADMFAPMRAGRAAGDLVEDMNRGSLYIALRRQGFTPEMAAMKVRAAHFDYQALTPFERTVMRRVVPFYTWASRNIPYQLEQLIQHPGGLTATGIKVGAAMRKEGGFVPSYLGGGLAIPIGDEDQGSQRFLTRTDLPFEQALEIPQFGPGGLEQTAMHLLGQTNPLIKGPLELATGKQFYTGRDLEDLYSVTGSPLAEQILMNSPLARAFTTGRQLADTRKGVGVKALNLLTGLKLSDVDMEKQRNVAAREIIDKSLRGQAGVSPVESLAVNPAAVAQMDPQQVALLRLYRSLENQSKSKIGVRQ